MGDGHSGRPVGPSTLRIFSVVGYPRWVSAFSGSAGSALLDTICIRCLLIKISIQTFFFVGSIHFEPAKRVWKSWAPPRCKFFIWLASLNRCWTTDRLARRGRQITLSVTKRMKQFNTFWPPVCLQGKSGSGCCLWLAYNNLHHPRMIWCFKNGGGLHSQEF